MRTALATKLNSIPGVAANVTGVFVMPLPQNAVPPYIVMNLIASNQRTTLGGPTSVFRDLWQVDIYAESHSTADTIRDAILDTTTGLQTRGPATWSGKAVALCVLDDSRDIIVKGATARTGVATVRKSMDFVIVYTK